MYLGFAVKLHTTRLEGDYKSLRVVCNINNFIMIAKSYAKVQQLF